MKTKARLTLALGALTLLVFVLGVVSIVSIRQLRGDGGEVLKANYKSLEYMHDMLTAMDGDPDSAASHMRGSLIRQQANITEPGEAEATRALERALSDWEGHGQDSSTTQQLVAHIQAVLDLNQKAIVRKATLSERHGDNAVTWITLAGTLCALIALSLLFGMAEFLSAPIRALTAGIDRIAEGNYRERVIMERRDEFGQLADRFNAMAAELEKWESSSLARIMEEKARAEAVIQSLQDASIGMDDQGVILFANQEALDLLNTTAEELVGRRATDVMTKNDLLRAVLGSGHKGPLKIVKDGREQFYTLERVPILRSGQTLGTVAVLRNITSFEEKDRAKTHFLATISHELKTPLASTDIGLTLLERNTQGRLSPEQTSILADLRKDQQRLVRLVSELLDLAQVETGNIRINSTEQALDILIDGALDAVRRQGEKKGILFARRTGGEGLWVKADGEKAMWVIINVLSNAVRHSPSGGVITLETGRDGTRTELSVSDQGPGIPPAEERRLFQRFAVGSRTDHGTGLGLAIAHEFMLAMGGSIEYQRSEVGGATFLLTFAAAPRTDERTAPLP